MLGHGLCQAIHSLLPPHSPPSRLPQSVNSSVTTPSMRTIIAPRRKPCSNRRLRRSRSGGSADTCMADPPLSRASSLLHRSLARRRPRSTAIPVGAIGGNDGREAVGRPTRAWLLHRHREQAHSYRACGTPQISVHRDPCRSNRRLRRSRSGGSADTCMADPPLSRASSLLHRRLARRTGRSTAIPVAVQPAGGGVFKIESAGKRNFARPDCYSCAGRHVFCRDTHFMW